MSKCETCKWKDAEDGWTEVPTMANERRLIYANEIEELFYAQVEYGATDLMAAFDDALQDATTVDAVEVVRCEECRYSTAPLCHKEYCKEKGILKCDKPGGIAFNRRVYSTDFCSYGKRKNENQ